LIHTSHLLRLFPTSWHPYIRHMRLRAFPLVAAHFSVGALLAGDLHFTAGMVWQWVAGIVLWAGFGHSGTLAFNSAFDKDEGDIGYLADPPPVPRYLWLFGLALLLLGALGALLLPLQFLLVYLICAAMSVAYSAPPIRLKALAGADVLNNALGYGVLTLYAGWAAQGRTHNLLILLVLSGFFCLAAAAYPLTQIYQYQEDLARGDRTLVIALGKRGALRWSLSFVLVAFAFLGAAASQVPPTLWSWALWAAFGGWLSVLIPWNARLEAYPEQKGMYRALAAWALTDLGVLLALLL
jgi:1,4-dihydroxy-2-naphthoate octaprenyltransferase